MNTTVTKTCSSCGHPKDYNDFPSRGNVCLRCLADREHLRNEATRRGADRLGDEYTSAEDAFILANYLQMTDEQLAHRLKRTLEGVRVHRERLGLMKHAATFPGRDDIDIWWLRRRTDIKTITVEHFDRDGDMVLAVYCPDEAPEEAIHGAFEAAGYTPGVFLGWLVNRRCV